MNQAAFALPSEFSSTDWLEECKDLFAVLISMESEPDLQRRRQAAVAYLCKYFQAGFGFWSWGHGHPETDGMVVPIAMIPWGLDPTRLNAFFQLGMSKGSDRWHREPFLPLLKQQMQVSRSRQHFWSDAQWRSSEFREELVKTAQLDEWMICVRYPTKHIWSCVSLIKNEGDPSFRDLDCVLLDLACAGISWLQSGMGEATEEQSVTGLGHRNAEVLHLLLDGRSRKEIAAALDLTMHIVNDCIKQIYSHFGATSATELAAIFLRRA